VPDEHITAQPRPVENCEITERRIEPPRSSDAGVEVPDIALPNSQKQRSRRPVHLALFFLMLAPSFLMCGLGAPARDGLKFYFILACFAAFVIALGISVTISIVRAIEYSRLSAAMRRRRQFERAISDSDPSTHDLNSPA